jgi:Spy/CpxP family protein refolding chaperone
MKQRLVLASVLAVALLGCGWLFGQDTKATPKASRGLPSGWGNLGLTDEQKQKVYEVQAEYRTKIDDLQQQIRKLQKEERSALSKVLTDAQRARLKEILASKAGDSSKEDKKPDKK